MLYKYVSVNSKSYTSILEHLEVYFASCHNLNDPFEGIPHYSLPTTTELKQYLVKKGAKRGKLKDFLGTARSHFEESQKFLNSDKSLSAETGIFCLTPNSNNLLMWSHYGDEHKGVCLGFDVIRPFDSVFGYGYEVEYSESYPKISVTRMNDLYIEWTRGNKSMEQFDDVATKQFFTKAECWKYEEEIRFIRPPLTDGIGLMSFPAIKLKEIILGCKIGKDDRDRTIGFAKKNFPHAKIFQLTMDAKYYRAVSSNKCNFFTRRVNQLAAP